MLFGCGRADSHRAEACHGLMPCAVHFQRPPTGADCWPAYCCKGSACEAVFSEAAGAEASQITGKDASLRIQTMQGAAACCQARARRTRTWRSPRWCARRTGPCSSASSGPCSTATSPTSSPSAPATTASSCQVRSAPPPPLSAATIEVDAEEGRARNGTGSVHERLGPCTCAIPMQLI